MGLAEYNSISIQIANFQLTLRKADPMHDIDTVQEEDKQYPCKILFT